MRLARRIVAVAGLAVAGLVLVPSAPGSAHPLGNFTVNLYTGVTVVPEQLRIFHVLDRSGKHQNLPLAHQLLGDVRFVLL